MTTPIQMSMPEMGGRRALGLALMALVFSLYLPAGGLVLALFGLVIAIRDLRVLHRKKQRTGMATSAVVISSVALLFGGFALAGQLYFSAEISAYGECSKGAGTVEARQDCSNQFKRAIEQKIGVAWPSDIPFPA
ncbi:hypothetical protein Psi02_36200 [Planotetraspora silvatica]|uniref:DUF4190 domain-containing protein n=1 Tax=Planotetraspora silvatica TaxID=234614 RepID=A0A8J3XPA0_9ACTN|nr:hypothetical protein [Planotetraspora silvatica]GII47196.1 hypothetical protein Psi02_36200 [Planotetraspora silvatica]